MNRQNIKQTSVIVCVGNESITVNGPVHSIDAFGFTTIFLSAPSWRGGWICGDGCSYPEIEFAPSYRTPVMTQTPVYN